MKKESFVVTAILFGTLFAILIIYLKITSNMTYEKAIKELSKTEVIIVKETKTLEQKASSRAYDKKITSKEQIREIINFITAGKNNQEECWHNLPSPDYEVKFLNNKGRQIAKFTILKDDEHLHLIGDGYNYRVDLDIKKLINILQK